jgi:hypothetical protein
VRFRELRVRGGRTSNRTASTRRGARRLGAQSLCDGFTDLGCVDGAGGPQSDDAVVLSVRRRASG